MMEDFCNSHFSFNEKRDLFFPAHPVIYRTCRRPRIKRLIDLNDFSLHHQNLICMFGHPHAVVPAAGGGGVPPAGAPPAGGVPPPVVPPAAIPPAAVPPAVVPPVAVPPAAVPPAVVPPAAVPPVAVPPVGGIPPTGAPHGGALGPAPHGGPHLNPLYVTRNEFNIFRNNINQNMQQLQNQFNLTTEDIAAKVGKSEASIQSTIRLLNLPDEAKKIMVKEKLTEGVMRPLVSRDEATIKKVLPKIVSEGWTARKVERYFAENKKKSSAAAIKSSAYHKSEDTLSAKYNVVTKITGRSLTFKCKSDSELHKLIDILSK